MNCNVKIIKTIFTRHERAKNNYKQSHSQSCCLKKHLMNLNVSNLSPAMLILMHDHHLLLALFLLSVICCCQALMASTRTKTLLDPHHKLNMLWFSSFCVRCSPLQFFEHQIRRNSRRIQNPSRQSQNEARNSSPYILTQKSLNKMCVQMSLNLFLQKVFGATFACGSFRPMKAADCSVAGSRTTLQNRIQSKFKIEENILIIQKIVMIAKPSKIVQERAHRDSRGKQRFGAGGRLGIQEFRTCLLLLRDLFAAFRKEKQDFFREIFSNLVARFLTSSSRAFQFPPLND